MRVFFCIFFCLLCNALRSQNAVTITNPEEVVNLAYTAEYCKDADSSLTINDFISGGKPVSFTTLGTHGVNFGITSYTYWVKTTFRNMTGSPLLIKVGNHGLTDVTVYETAGPKLVSQYRTGSWVAYKDKIIKDVDFLFPLAIGNNQTTTVYIRVFHYRGTEFPLVAGTQMAFALKGTADVMTEGIYYGFMLLMILYNLFLYFSLRDSSYLYYVAYIFFMGLLNATINGYATRFFWPSAPVLNQYEDIIPACTGMAGILFVASFLNTRKNVPVFHNIFIGLFAGYIAVIIIVLSGFLKAGTIAVEMLSIVLVVIFFIAAYRTMNKGYKPAKFFLIAWSFLLLSVIIFILEDYRILPYNSFTENSLQIGSALEALLLSFALANRINVYKQEKESAQSENLRALEENEQLVREQNVHLEKKVEERTAALKKANTELIKAMENLNTTQAQLVQKEKMASLGELTAGIAHEIQNPLNFVNNFSEVNAELTEELKAELQKASPDNPLANIVSLLLTDLAQNNQKIAHHGKRADAIVKGMLQHSRTSSGEKELFNINDLADEYLRLSYHGLRAKDKNFNAGFRTHFDETIEPVKIIPQDIGRVLLNLFNNAFYAVSEKSKAHKYGYEPLVEVKTKQEGDRVYITVSDNGTGVPKEVQDKIFQPFFTTKPTGEGTGLGLSLSYDIITQAHGGELHLKTEEGVGSEFIIELPTTGMK